MVESPIPLEAIFVILLTIVVIMMGALFVLTIQLSKKIQEPNSEQLNIERNIQRRLDQILREKKKKKSRKRRDSNVEAFNERDLSDEYEMEMAKESDIFSNRGRKFSFVITLIKHQIGTKKASYNQGLFHWWTLCWQNYCPRFLCTTTKTVSNLPVGCA